MSEAPDPSPSAPPHGAAATPGQLSDADRRQGVLFLSLAVAAVGVAMALQMGLNANFMADEIRVSGFQIGLLEASRETCGITALLVLAALAGLSEPVVGTVVLVVFAAGLGGYWYAPTYVWVLMMSLVWSQGLHVWMPLPGSMAMGLAEPGRTGQRLGWVQAAGTAGFGVGLVLASGLTWLGVPMRPLYLVAAVFGLLAAAACLGIPRGIRTPGPSFVFRRRYGLYYLLCFLDGCRKQIAICFAGFLLVRVYHLDLQHMLALQIVVQVIGCFSSPLVGRLIDRMGERRLLGFYFASLTVFFTGYALLRNRNLLCAVFVLDSAFFVFGMALTTYVNRLTPPAERTPTLSMGVAMNHVAAVIMPLTGGILWQYLGPQWTFAMGASAALLSVFATLRLPAFVPPPTPAAAK